MTTQPTGERILVVDDEPDIIALVAYHLVKHGYRVSTASSGPEALAAAQQDLPALIILDLMLPGKSGYEVLEELRQMPGTKDLAVLLLTARKEEEDRIRGLALGADDYLTKPFALEELLARVRALGRRGGDEHQDQLTVGDLILDLARHEARRGESSIELTAKEFDLLAYLMRNAGRVLSKDQITEHVWGYDSQATSNVVEIYIHYLRDKIDRGYPRPLIRTIRGVGYSIKE